MTVRDGEVILDGSPVFVGGQSRLLESISDLTRSGQVELLVTPNVDQVLRLQTDPRWRRVYASASMRIADGAPLVFLARALGNANAVRNTGADLLPLCVELSVKSGWTIAITGGAEATLRKAVAMLKSRYPGSDLWWVPFPRITAEDDPASIPVVEQLREIDPDIVFVCLGAPKQELWVDVWRETLPAALYVGSGAAVDFAAGSMQRAGLEWLWRLLHEPRRLAKRYLVRGPSFLGVVWRSIRANGFWSRRNKGGPR